MPPDSPELNPVERRWQDLNSPLDGLNEMDPPLCESASMSHNEFKPSDLGGESMTRELSVVGLDLAKRRFHRVGTAQTGKIVCRPRLCRSARMPLRATRPPVLVAMEA